MKHSLYGGKIVLNFDEKRHRYTIGKRVIPSVTSVLKILNKPALVPWAAKMVAEKMLRTMPRDSVMGTINMYWDDFEELVAKAKNAPRDIKDDAGDVGTQAHKVIEGCIETAIEYNDGVIHDGAFCPMLGCDPRISNCVYAALDFVKRHHVIWQKTETVVYSSASDFAGMMDGLALVSSCDDKRCCPFQFTDVLSVIDWKSSNRLHAEYLLQTAAYQQAYEEEFEAGIADRWILRLGKEDGEFEAWHTGPEEFAADLEAFQLCVNLNKAMKVVEKRVALAAKNKPKELDWLEE